jgi:signal transduction histidine kinase
VLVDGAGLLDRVRRRAWGLSGRLIASYILVTLAVVVLVEALVLGFQVPPLMNGAKLQTQVDATANSYAQQLSQRYPGGVPAGTVLGDPQPMKLGLVQPAPNGTLLVPAITDPIPSDRAVTAVVAIAADGTVVASSAPFRYPAGRAAASELPDQAAYAISPGPFVVKGGSVPTTYGSVLFGVLASQRVVRRVRRLERATLAVADGDYTVTLPVSGRDEVGRLEANFTTMTRQLGSALAAERQRATVDARVAERARIAREVHDAISQHLFALRMIAAGMRRADPVNQQAMVIERISEDALRDMQALLIELHPVCLDGAGLAPALQEICVAYYDRLGVTVDADLDDVTVPAPVEHALLRITQEACANAVRHGGARRLALSMTRQDGHVELAVRDSGTGFDPAATRVGSGLTHIRDRVAELGGTVDIDSAPGHGAAVTVRVPVP